MTFPHPSPQELGRRKPPLTSCCSLSRKRQEITKKQLKKQQISSTSFPSKYRRCREYVMKSSLQQISSDIFPVVVGSSSVITLISPVSVSSIEKYRHKTNTGNFFITFIFCLLLPLQISSTQLS